MVKNKEASNNSFTLPNVETLRKRGRFYGYHLPGYYEIWRLGKVFCMIVDGYSHRKYWQYVEPYQIEEDVPVYAGFSPLEDGTPLLRE